MGMLSKYAILYYIFSLIIATALIDKIRLSLFRRELIYVIIISITIFLPNLIWNFEHGLVTFNHTFDNANLNNLRIDDSQKSDSEPFPTKIVSIIVSGLAIIGLGLWFLLADEEIQEVTTFTVKSINTSGSQASSILDVEFNSEKIISAINRFYSKKFLNKIKSTKNPYGKKNTSKLIIKIIKEKLKKEIKFEKNFFDLKNYI